ncbi:MAG: NAD+ synthase [candidate division Zixibacteria bacterium]|nr:NAD+ synthase [candidate division Zixibacteria bacterium]
MNLNEREIAQKLEAFLAGHLKKAEFEGYIVGLSGGIDSSLSATIAVKAVGKEKIYGLIMPYRHSSSNSEKDALAVAAELGIKTEKIDISPMISAYYGDIKKVNPIRLGNKMARERMSILFDKAHEHKALVLGTSNRTEICLGYGTWYGDIACSINPIGMLYKTQIRQMACYYGLPPAILAKIPTADLWPGQTDEGELGLQYSEVDQLLSIMIDKNITFRRELNDAGFDDHLIDRAVSLLNKSSFKRRLPEIADIGLHPIPNNIVIL